MPLCTSPGYATDDMPVILMPHNSVEFIIRLVKLIILKEQKNSSLHNKANTQFVQTQFNKMCHGTTIRCAVMPMLIRISVDNLSGSSYLKVI